MVIEEFPGESAERQHSLDHKGFLRLCPPGNEEGVLDLQVGIGAQEWCRSESVVGFDLWSSWLKRGRIARDQMRRFENGLDSNLNLACEKDWTRLATCTYNLPN